MKDILLAYAVHFGTESLLRDLFNGLTDVARSYPFDTLAIRQSEQKALCDAADSCLRLANELENGR